MKNFNKWEGTYKMNDNLVLDQIASLSLNQQKDLLHYSLKQLKEKNQKLLLHQKYFQKLNNFDISLIRKADKDSKLPSSPNTVYLEIKKAIKSLKTILIENFLLKKGYHPDRNY